MPTVTLTFTNFHVLQAPLGRSKIETAPSTLHHTREGIAGSQHQSTEFLLDSVLSSGVVGWMFLLVVVMVVIGGGYLVGLGGGG